MRRRRVKRRDDGITLFPFLAVLICTMGSLIVLLVVVMQQAKANAADVSQQRQSQRQKLDREIQQLREKKEEFQWRIEVLESSRSQTAEQLEDRRRALSHLENEIRELSRHLDRAVAEAERIAQLEYDQVADSEDSRHEAKQLRDALKRAQEDLELARQELVNRKRSYSIVPYKGAHGTERRPIFVECLNDRIVLQPEGIELTSRDFQEPLTDENPLAAALRAKREYLGRTLQGADGEPYPLLIVRPDGASSYAAARAAMKSWNAEFGYELIESDIQLNYPKRDPLLAKALQYTVREARDRRRQLQSIAPGRFGRQVPATFTASRTGGFVRNGGESANGAGARRPPFGPPTGSPTGSFTHRGNGPGTSESVPGQSAPGQFPPGAPSGGGNPGDAANRASGVGSPAGGSSGGEQFGQGPHEFAAHNAGPNGPNGATDQTDGQLQQQGLAGSDGQPQWNSNPGPESGAEGNQSANRSAPGSASRSGSPSAASQGSSAASSQTSAQIGASSVGGLSGGMAPPSSIAQSLGADWGLPNRSAGSTGITRPIQLVVSGDRLEMLPEDPRSREQRTQLAIDGAMRDEIEELIPAIWKRMDGWGIAGAGMYWKPILSVQVRPGAESRFQEFVMLMKNSGLVVQRKQK